MVVDLRAKTTTLIVAGQDLTDYLDEFTVQDDYLSESGKVATKGTLKLTEFPGGVSLDDWTGIPFLRIGSQVDVWVEGVKHPRGRLYVQSAEYADGQANTTIEVACLLGARSFASPTDETLISLPPNATARDVVDQLFELAGCGTPTWIGGDGTSLSFCVPPQLSGSYIDSACKILASMGLFAYQNNLGGIEIYAALDSPLIATLTKGDLSAWERVTVGQPPATTAKVSGSYGLCRDRSTEANVSVVQSLGDIGAIVPPISGRSAVGYGVTCRTTTIDQAFPATSTLRCTTTEEKLGYQVYRGLNGVSGVSLVQSCQKVVDRKFAADKSALLRSIEETQTVPLYSVMQGYCDYKIGAGESVAISNSVTLRRTTSYFYDANEVITQIVEESYEPVGKVIGELSGVDWSKASQFFVLTSPTLAERRVTSFEQISPTEYRKTEQAEFPAVRDSNGQNGLLERLAKATNDDQIRNAYASAIAPVASVVTVTLSTNGNANPPASERFPAMVTTDSKQAEATVEFDGFASGWSQREQSYSVPSLGDFEPSTIAQSQAEGLAYNYGAIWHQVAINRHKSVRVEMPLIAELADYRPYAGVLVDDYYLALNGTSWAITPTRCLVSSDCSFLGTAVLVGGQEVAIGLYSTRKDGALNMVFELAIDVVPAEVAISYIQLSQAFEFGMDVQASTPAVILDMAFGLGLDEVGYVGFNQVFELGLNQVIPTSDVVLEQAFGLGLDEVGYVALNQAYGLTLGAVEEVALNQVFSFGLNPYTSQLLDTVVGTQNAYSLRLISSAYTGAAIRVRRSSDNTEQDIGFSGGTLDTTALLAFVGSGNGFVKTWYDQSGNGRNAISDTDTTKQPQIVSSGSVITSNGKPAIQFLGIKNNSNGWTALNASTSITGYDLLGCFVATMSDSTQYAGRLLSVGVLGGDDYTIAGSAAALCRSTDTGGYLEVERYYNSGSATTISLDTAFQASTEFTSSGNRIYRNGTAGTLNSSLAGTFSATGLTIGQKVGAYTAAWNGKVSEVIVCNSTTSRTTIEADQKAYYGTP